MKKFSPVTSSQRHTVLVNKTHLWKCKPFKNLTFYKFDNAGRNNTGHITVFHRGSGHRKKLRVIDFYKTFFGIPFKSIGLEFDPNRSSFISLVVYKNGLVTYQLANFKLPLNSVLYSTFLGNLNNLLHLGFNSPLNKIPLGSLVNSVELYPSKGAQLIRSAGGYGQVLRHNIGIYSVIKLRSKEKRLINSNCFCTVGMLSNITHKLIVFGKAGRNRWLGKNPITRGVAMNAVDHPHGGATSGGKIWVTPWGIATKCKKTRTIKNPWIFNG